MAQAPSCLPATLPGGWAVHRVLTEPAVVPMYPISATSHVDGAWTIGGTTQGTIAVDAKGALAWSPAGETALGGPDTHTGVAERLTADGETAWTAWADGAPFLYTGDGGGDQRSFLWAPLETSATTLHVTGREPTALSIPASPGSYGVPPSSLLVARLEADGATGWARAFGLAEARDMDGGNPGVAAEAVTVLADGGLAVLGSAGRGVLVSSATALPLATWTSDRERAPFLMRLDADGRFAWGHVFDGSDLGIRSGGASDWSDGGVAMIVNTVGGLRVSGEAVTLDGLTGPQMSPVLVAFDAEGRLAVAALLAVSPGEWFTAEGLTRLDDGDLLVFGAMTAPATFGTNDDDKEHVAPLGTSTVQPFVARYAPDGELRWARAVGRFDGTAQIGGRVGPAVGNGRYFAGVATGPFALGEGDNALAFPGDGEDSVDFLAILTSTGEVTSALQITGTTANFGWGAYMSAGPDGRIRLVTSRRGESALVTPGGRLDLLDEPGWDPFDFDASRTLMLELEPTDAAPNVETCSDWWHPTE